MSWLSNLFGGGHGGGGGSSNPMGAANQYLDKIPQIGHDYYDPYITQGSTAGQTAQKQYDTMTNDPAGFINRLMEQYKPSEGYQFQKGQLEKEMGNTAAAGGIAGTPLDQMNQAQGVQGLLSQDMQQFLSNVLGQHKEGLAGEEGVSERGFNASKSLADLLGGALNQQGGLAFQGAQQKNSDRNSMLGALAKALGMGAGAFFGGAPGALIGGGLGSSMFGGG